MHNVHTQTNINKCIEQMYLNIHKEIYIIFYVICTYCYKKLFYIFT